MEEEGRVSLQPPSPYEDGLEHVVPENETAEIIIRELVHYAYENDLTRDYQLNSFSTTNLFAGLLQSTIPATTEDAFTDYSHLADLELPNPSPREAFRITDSAFRLISQACRILKDDEVQILIREVRSADNVKYLKLELPILRTDNDWDMREFQREMVDRQDVPIRDHRLPLEPLSDEDGEGMELPASARSESETIMKNIEADKLVLTRDSLKYLFDQLKVEYTEEDRTSFLVEEVGEIKYENNTALEKLTPPISPKLGQEYFVPKSDTCLVSIPSDPSSMLSDDLRDVEDRLFKEHGDVWSEGTSPIRKELDKDLLSPDEYTLLQSPRENIDDLKIELPLLQDQAPGQPTPSGPDAFKDFVAAEMGLDSEFENAILQSVPDDDLQEQLQKVADETIKAIEQEQLHAADATARVPIPVMDFSIAEPEWTRLRDTEVSIFKWIQGGHEELFNIPKWPKSKVTESQLIWMPIGQGAKSVSETETMEDSESLVQTFIEASEEDGMATSLEFIQSKGRLTVLQDEDEDEEIEPQLAHIKPRANPVDIVRKRSLDINGSENPKRTRRSANQPLSERTIQSEGLSLLPGDSLGASEKLLTNFMDIHAPKKRWTHSKYFPSKKEMSPMLPSPPETSDGVRGSGGIKTKLETQATEQSKAVPRAPCPLINPPSTPMTVFISLRISRRMIRALDRLIPELTLVERDYDAHNASVWLQGSVSRTEVIPPLANDADITVSPTTGLITTSVIRIRQKPPPGAMKSTIQARIETVSLRYERLIILVGGEGGPDDTLTEISPSDSAALTELQGFASGLRRNILVHYVGGGDETLWRWVASRICQYGRVGPEVQNGVLEAETLWEVFLRRAGFNVYAAQAIAHQLKPPHSENGLAQSPLCGLSAFFTMTRAERMQRFGQTVGPGVLERVSKTLDEIWNQI